MSEAKRADNVVDLRAARSARPAAPVAEKAQPAGKSEVVMLPGMDFRLLADSLDYWRRTGRSWAGDPGGSAA